MLYRYKTKGVCARMIEVELDGDVVKSLNIIGGCNGNSKGLSKIVEGMSVEEIKNKFSGIRCDSRPSSCPDQIAIAVSEAYAADNK